MSSATIVSANKQNFTLLKSGGTSFFIRDISFEISNPCYKKREVVAICNFAYIFWSYRFD